MKTIASTILLIALLSACAAPGNSAPSNTGTPQSSGASPPAIVIPRAASTPQSNFTPTCSASLTVQLETFGEGVTIELRQGSPGSSVVNHSQRSSGGQVYFGQLCTGSYFMAIGNEESVSVTPVRQFVNGRPYRSTIRVTPSGGNITRRSRGTL